jgi:hypothetical protein
MRFLPPDEPAYSYSGRLEQLPATDISPTRYHSRLGVES